MPTTTAVMATATATAKAITITANTKVYVSYEGTAQQSRAEQQQ